MKIYETRIKEKNDKKDAIMSFLKTDD